MSECTLSACPQEESGATVYRLSSAVKNEELICRSVRPTDYGAKNILKASFIQTGELRKGQLSVWRVTAVGDLPTIAEKLGIGEDDDRNVLATPAMSVRSVRIGERHRSFSVINDTRTDEIGGHDPLHAAIAACQFLLLEDGDIETLMPALKAALGVAFRGSTIALRPVAMVQSQNTSDK